MGFFLLTFEAKSEILRWPQLCLNGKLTVKNSGTQNLRAWIQHFSDDGRTETEVAVRAFSQIDFSINAWTSSDRFALMHFADPRKVSAQFTCEKTGLSIKAHSLEGGVMTFSKSDLNENKIWLQNLFTAENTVKIEWLDANQKVIHQEDLNLQSFEQRNYKPDIEKLNVFQLRISAANRFTAFTMTSTGARGPNSVKVQTSTVDLQSAYFVVGPRGGGGDSFVARISDPIMIARARELIQHPEYEKMLFAKIEKGHQGFNRNFNKSEKSFWSWSITEVTNFADYGSTACNGFPQLVEDTVDSWVQNPGRICFWEYRVQKELSIQEITQDAP